jgi:predicted Fe-Mo cluster-binding NifX family protein
VITGNAGPNAFNVFQPASVPVYLFGGGTVRQAVDAYKEGRLSTAGGANIQAHAGMGMGRGVGMRTDMGRRAGRALPQTSPASPAASREEEIASLKDMAGGLREQLAEVMARLDQLEKDA